jgi:hypothetical protein
LMTRVIETDTICCDFLKFISCPLECIKVFVWQ